MIQRTTRPAPSSLQPPFLAAPPLPRCSLAATHFYSLSPSLAHCPFLCARYSRSPVDFSATYERVKEILTEAFFGPPDRGVFSPAVQTTLYDMCKAVIGR